MLNRVVAFVLLFPWSLLALGLAALLRRRRPTPSGLRLYPVIATLQPNPNPPRVLDSAQIVRELKRRSGQHL